ncbi:MAG: DUF1080 domain-containing protein [Acidobacteria bacterium]|nr:DUF1080 domain-containing protein [Acidobacteriota bacterium]
MQRRLFCALLPSLAAAADALPKAFPAAQGWKPFFPAGSLAAWRPQDNSRPNTWSSSTRVTLDPADAARLSATPTPGPEVWNSPTGKVTNIVTTETFGDLELAIEFMVPKGSNSGIYLHGLYEIQVFDSFGVTDLKTSDCGAIYHRWIDAKPVGGSAPKVNATRAPGQWQSFRAFFRAPRFDAQGRKTANARFLRVLLNGTLIQENVEVEGGTRSHMPIPEAPRNPIMIQGDHGPVAYRNLFVRPLRAEDNH